MAGGRGVMDFFKNWEKGGKSQFLEKCHAAAQKMPNVSLPDKNVCKDVLTLLHDLCSHVIIGNIKVELATSTIQEVMGYHSELPSLVVDLFLVLDFETLSTDNQEHRERFILLVAGCRKFLPDELLKERIDIETAGEAQIVKSSKLAATKFIKIKTRLYYKQQKYNMFREESEGYAKLMTELNQGLSPKTSPEYMIEVIRSLIGCFNLDPNRVIDVILEAFECRLDLAEFFVSLLKKFLCNSATLSQILGFKFTFYKLECEPAPSSLYQLAALLIKNNLITLDHIYSLLVPDDSKITEAHKEDVQSAKTYARRMNIAVIAEKTEENKEENKDEDMLCEDNQKLGLCAAMLEVGDWKNASILLNHLPEYYAISKPEISEKLAHLIHTIINPLYLKYSGLPSGFGKVYENPSGFRKVERLSETFDDFQELAFPLIVTMGPLLHRDAVLMVKIIRICRTFLQQKNYDPEKYQDLKYDIVTIIDEALLPSLSLLECNCCLAEELWTLLKLFPYQQRYRLYSQWKNNFSSHPLLIRAKADTLKKTKYIMKRLSKENVKPSGRQIGKLSHSNPCFLFDYILSQIQTWDNLISPVVDSLKYLTLLSYDVLSFCIIEALCNPEKDRMKHDGTSLSLWLQSLANFCGAVYKKYLFELTGLLQLVANQLKAEKSLDLLVLKEIVQKMAGIESTEETTLEQLEAMSGGELLKAEGGYFNQLRNTKKSSQKLKEALLEQDLAVPLCLLMAQQRNCILYHEQENSHLKLVGKLYDQCQDTLVQFGTFLSTSLTMEEYVNRLPPIEKLLSQYHIQADVAFFLARPVFNYSINLVYEEIKRHDKNFRNLTVSQKLQKYGEAVENVMKKVVNNVRPLHSQKTWDDLSPQFYVTFWSLSMYDLHVPSSSYEREVNKLKQQINQIDDNKDMIQSKKKKEKERCSALIEKLQEEEKKQQEHCTRILSRLKNEKETWFQSRSAKNETITQFLQLCVFPRCTFTALDALYCAKFVHLIHTLKTPNFSTLICYDRIFCDITYTVSACTENEANRYGRFLCAMLETVMRWHSDKAIFERECANFPGFMTKFRGASQSSDIATDHVDYENYRHVCHKWHFKITKALVICLESGDYIQIRNSLIVLTKILPHFPVMNSLGQALERRIEKIRLEEKDKRPDLFALATGYSGQLKGKKSCLIPEHEFHVKDNKDTRSQAVTNVKQEVGAKIANSTDATKDKKQDAKTDSQSSSAGKGANTATKATPSVSSSTRKDQNKTQRDALGENANEKVSSTDRKNQSSFEEPKPSSKDDRRDKKDDESSIHKMDTNAASDGHHYHWGEGNDDHKRRKVDSQISKSPRVEEKNDDKSDPKEKYAHPKDGRESSVEKAKGKDKKNSRKREYTDESSSESKRKKDEESGKSFNKRNGEDLKEKERYSSRREEASPKTHESRTRERRTERDEKKHHRNVGTSSISSAKKRSSQ